MTSAARTSNTDSDKPVSFTEGFYNNPDKVWRVSQESEVAIKSKEIRARGLLFHILDELSTRFREAPIEKLVEVGGGSGINLRLAMERCRIKDAISIDIYEPPAQVPGIQYLKLTADRLAGVIPTGSVDAVLLIEVIEHLVDPDTAVLAIKKILKSNGVLILTTPNLSSLVNRLTLLLGYVPFNYEVSTRRAFGRPAPEYRDGQMVGHLRLFTFGAIKEFLEYHGFRVETDYTVSHPFEKPVGSAGLRFRLIVTGLNMIDRFSVRFSKRLGQQILIVARPRM
jgi:SAM-dependent methyltransferase